MIFFSFLQSVTFSCWNSMISGRLWWLYYYEVVVISLTFHDYYGVAVMSHTFRDNYITKFVRIRTMWRNPRSRKPKQSQRRKAQGGTSQSWSGRRAPTTLTRRTDLCMCKCCWITVVVFICFYMMFSMTWCISVFVFICFPRHAVSCGSVRKILSERASFFDLTRGGSWEKVASRGNDFFQVSSRAEG